MTTDGTYGADKKEAFLWKVIGRYDSYYGATNAKASALIAFNVFVVTGVALKWTDFSKSLPYAWAQFLAAATLFVAVGASFVSLWATWKIVAPYLGSAKEPCRYHSALFFEHVAEHSTAEAYASNLQGLTPEATLADLSYQAHALACGLRAKFRLLTIAARAILYAQLPALATLFLLHLGMSIAATLKVP